MPIEETWAAILELVAEGKVRHGGISNHRPAEVEKALTVGPVAALQYEYSVLARGVEETILPLALARGLGVIVRAPLASGFLTDDFAVESLHEDDFRRGHPFAQLELEPVRSALEPADELQRKAQSASCSRTPQSPAPSLECGTSRRVPSLRRWLSCV